MVTKKRTREVIYSKFLLLIGGKCEAEGGAGTSDGHTAEVAEVKLEPRSLDSVESSFEYRIPAAHHEDLILLKSRKLKLGSQTRVSPDCWDPSIPIQRAGVASGCRGLNPRMWCKWTLFSSLEDHSNKKWARSSGKHVGPVMPGSRQPRGAVSSLGYGRGGRLWGGEGDCPHHMLREPSLLLTAEQ